MPRRSKISYFNFYSDFRKEEIQSLTKKFSKEQIDFAIDNIVVSISAIIRHYNAWSTSSDCIKAIPLIRKNILDPIIGSESLDSLPKSHLYKEARIFVHKEQKKILQAMEEGGVSIPDSQKIPQFLNMLSDLAEDCLDVCLAKFEKEIEKIKIEEKEQEFEKMIDKRLQKAESNKENSPLFTEVKSGEKRLKAGDESKQKESESNVIKLKRRRMNPKEEGESKSKKSVSWSSDISGGNGNRTTYVGRVKERRRAAKKEESLSLP